MLSQSMVSAMAYIESSKAEGRHYFTTDGASRRPRRRQEGHPGVAGRETGPSRVPPAPTAHARCIVARNVVPSSALDVTCTVPP